MEYNEHIMRSPKILTAAALCWGLLAEPLAFSQEQRQEESEDYFKKWLREDVVYIISDEERKVFQQLSTEEEKEQFVEQFWFRRDPNPRTAENEFKQEHYRRIAYANERFASGLPGWMTDRGRIYIIHGEPAEIESRPTGGTYERPFHEGGGSTTTYPFEVWRYRYIEGVGDDIILEFVDPTSSGEYRLALNPEEKDALLHVPGAGLTAAEQLGLASKADRPYFSPGNRDAYPLQTLRARDNPFDRYRTFAMVQAAPEIKYKDLQELVKINVTYENLPFRAEDHYYRLNEAQVLVPITLQVENKNLAYRLENGRQVARVAVYGLITSITNRIAGEFEDDLQLAYPAQDFDVGIQNSAIYQKVVALEGRTRYKVDLVVKDLHSGNVGVVRRALVPPKFPDEKLMLSTLVLSDAIQVLDQIPDGEAMFVLGDVKIRPNLNRTFRPGRPLGLYLQIYNAGYDQSTFEPSLRITYQLMKDGKKLVETVDEEGASIQLASMRRVVLIQSIPSQQLKPGKYSIRLQVEDLIGQQSASAQQDFEIEADRGVSRQDAKTQRAPRGEKQ